MTSASEWVGPVGDVWAREWRRTDRSFAGLSPQLAAAILASAPPQGRFVDLGCGAGETSLAAATARPAATILGIDLSPELIAVAAQRGAVATNLCFVVGDAATATATDGPVDLYFSRHGVMFYDDPIAAFALLRAKAAPGAKLVFSCFRAASLNPWASEVAAAIQGQASVPPVGYAPGPFAFADPAFVSATLAAAGWQDATAVPADFRYVAGAGADPVADALDFFAQIGPAAPALRAADPAERAAMRERLRAVIARHHHGDTVDFPAAAWLWTAAA